MFTVTACQSSVLFETIIHHLDLKKQNVTFEWSTAAMFCIIVYKNYR